MKPDGTVRHIQAVEKKKTFSYCTRDCQADEYQSKFSLYAVERIGEDKHDKSETEKNENA